MSRAREELVGNDDVSIACASKYEMAGAPNENIVQNHLNMALLNVF